MSKSPVTHIPAKPALTETTVKLIAPAEPEKFVVTLTRAQAMYLRACLGVLTERHLEGSWKLYSDLPDAPVRLDGSSATAQQLAHAAKRCSVEPPAADAPSPTP